MPTLTIKNVPPDLHERLKESARRHRRSMNSEAITLLERALMPARRRDAETLIAEAKALNKKVGKTFPDIVNDAKREGRA
ncbi:MAG: Arc family DNA-binding protein [Bacteroidetes bacterium]|jgi:plasmid stability protein|nr:Arc family DNA-binding protein [Bacteroidota bacterium]